ncbi:hypothetical protein MMPV_006459 [Pyropia vietnamensis]
MPAGTVSNAAATSSSSDAGGAHNNGGSSGGRRRRALDGSPTAERAGKMSRNAGGDGPFQSRPPSGSVAETAVSSGRSVSLPTARRRGGGGTGSGGRAKGDASSYTAACRARLADRFQALRDTLPPDAVHGVTHKAALLSVAASCLRTLLADTAGLQVALALSSAPRLDAWVASVVAEAPTVADAMEGGLALFCDRTGWAAGEYWEVDGKGGRGGETAGSLTSAVTADGCNASAVGGAGGSADFSRGERGVVLRRARAVIGPTYGGSGGERRRWLPSSFVAPPPPPAPPPSVTTFGDGGIGALSRAPLPSAPSPGVAGDTAAIATALTTFCSASKDITFAPHVGVPGRVYATLLPEWLTGLPSASPATFVRARLAAATSVRTVLAVPLTVGGVVTGVAAWYDTRDRPYEAATAELAARIAGELGNAYGARQMGRAAGVGGVGERGGGGRG